MERPAALIIVQRYVPLADADALLTEHTVTRTVLGVPTPLYDPYAAAVAYLMHPDTVTRRTAGSWTEEYLDPMKLVAWLEGQSAILRASWPVDDNLLGGAFPDLRIDVRGW